MTIVARAKGIRAGFDVLQNNVYRTVVWGSIEYDTHPQAGNLVSGLLVKIGGSNDPSGNIYLRETGYYRIKAQLYLTTSSNNRSFYAIIRSLGTTGSSPQFIICSNEEVPPGQHPAVIVDAIVKNDVFGTYYDIQTQAISVPAATSALQTGGEYTWLEVHYLGGLDSAFPSNGTVDLSAINASIAALQNKISQQDARLASIENNPTRLPSTLTLSGGTLNLGAL